MRIGLIICLWTVCLFFPARLVSGQAKGTVSGVVIDSVTREPLLAVNISTDRRSGTITDLNGAFSLTLDPGEHTIEFSYVGYSDQRRAVTISSGETTRLEIEMKRSSKLLDEVVVSAGKYEQKLSEVTVSMELIKPYQLSNQNIVSLDMILERTPGISILDGQPSIRGGSGFSYGVGSRVLMLVDDMPMISADAGDIKWNYMPVENIGQVEVIKGAASVLYGSAALNGAINLQTRTPDIDPLTEITLFGGGYMSPARRELIWRGRPSLFTGGSFIHLRKIGNLDLSFGGNYFKDEGYRESDYENRIRGDLGLKYRFRKVQGLTVGLAASGMYANQSDFILWQNADSGAFRQNPASMAPLVATTYNIDPSVEYLTKRGNKHSLKTRLYSVGNATINSDLSSYSKLWYAEYRYSKRFRSRTHWTSGLAFSRQTVLANLFQNHTGTNSAVFSQLDAHLFNKLQVSTGVRWELNTLNGDLFLSLPILRAGLTYQAAKGTFLRSSIGQGYRFPSVAEKYAEADVGGVKIFRNPDLEPERGWSAEVGVKQEMVLGSSIGLVDVALFWTEYNDMIEYTFGAYPPNPDDIPTFEDVGFKALNISRARINGIDATFSLKGKMGPVGLTFSGGYTLMNPVDPTLLDSAELVAVDGQILNYRRRHLAKGDLEADFWKLFAGINLQFNSRMINVDKVFLDPFVGNLLLPGFPDYWTDHSTGYILLDFRLGWNITRMIRINTILRNAMNVEYLGRPGDIGPPRNITFQLRLEF